MKVLKDSVKISQEEYERNGTAVLKDAVYAFAEKFNKGYEIIVRQKTKRDSRV